MPTPETMNDPLHPMPAPIEYAGQWVAWNKNRTQIVAHGANLRTAHQAAVAAGYPNALLQKVRRPNTIFIGTT